MAEILGYTYRYLCKVWQEMRERAFNQEGIEDTDQDVRSFILMHLEKVVEVAGERIGRVLPTGWS